MSKNWIAVNVILIVVAALLGWQLYVAAKRFNAENDLAKMQPVVDVKQRISAEGGLPPLRPPRRYNPAEFANIPDQNLFSETRAREEKAEAAAVPATPPLAIKPILVGVTISGSQRLASIIDPTVPAGGRRTVIKRPGDVFQGYVITDITDSQMVLESGTNREIIPLEAGNKRSPQAGKTPILATRVVPFGAGGAPGTSGQGPSVVAVSAGAPRPGQPSGSQVNTVVGARETAGPMGSQGGVVRPAQQPQLQQGRQAPAQQWNEGVDSQGRRIIRTPFGDIPRPTTPPPNNQ